MGILCGHWTVKAWRLGAASSKMLVVGNATRCPGLGTPSEPGRQRPEGQAGHDGRSSVRAAVARRSHKELASWYALRSLPFLRSIAIRHRVRLLHAVATATGLWGLQCVPTRQADRKTLSSTCSTMLSQVVWASRRAGETGVDFFVHGRHRARD